MPMKELIGQTMASSLTSSAITFKGFVSQTQEEEGEKKYIHTLIHGRGNILGEQ